MGAVANERVVFVIDRSFYASGETVWLRGWISDVEGAAPTSKYLYVELLRDGVGSVEMRIKLKERGGMFLGQMELPEDLESGWYTLRAYTLAQKDWPAEALFHTRVLIRGTGAIPGLYAAPPAQADNDERVQAKIVFDTDGHLSVSLIDTDGSPVAGNFALSVVPGRYADFDYQQEQAIPPVPSASFVEGPREYAQELAFRVKSVRRRLPEQYNVAIMSQDIGYYVSTDIAGDNSVSGKDGQLFRIPDLNFPEGTLFSVNVTGSPYIYPESEPVTNYVPNMYDEAMRLYTSGTTGKPKGVPVFHANEVMSAHDVLMHFPMNPNDVTINTTPWFHRGGIHSGGPCPTLYAGATIVIMKTFQSLLALKYVEKYKITFLIGVPSIIKMLVCHQEKYKADLSSLRGIITMGAPFERADCLKVHEVLSPNLFNGYGTTETF